MKSSKLLNITHLNVCSLKTKYHAIHHELSEKDVDFFCVTESLLKPNQRFINFPNYKIIRKDIEKEGRGVAIIYKKQYKIHEINLNHIYDNNSNIEQITISVKNEQSKEFIISCVYRHTVYDKSTLTLDYATLKNHFNYVLESGKNIFIFGDFNLPKETHINPFITILNELNLHQLVDQPTRKNNILDLVIVNNQETIKNCKVYPPHISDHSATECIINIKKIKYPKIKLTYRNYKTINLKNLYNDLNIYLITDKLNNDPESSSEYLCKSIKALFDDHAPIKSIHFTQYPNKKYISNETKTLMKLRDIKYKQIKRLNFPRKLENELKSLNKTVKNRIKYDTKIALNNKILEKGLWKPLECIKPRQKQEIPATMDVEEINDFFVNISTKTTNQSKYPELQQITNKKFQFQPINVNDIKNSWKKTRNPSKCSPDLMHISNKMLDICIKSPTFLLHLKQTFNQCIQHKTFPNCFKQAKIVPIPKIPNPSSPNELRPISIQPVFAKLLDKCMYNQLSSYIFDNKFISKTQFGFQPRHSTTHALIALTDHLHDHIALGNVSIIISIDIAKGFDTVNRDIVIKKLISLGVESELLKSYLNNRKQSTTIIRQSQTIFSQLKTTTLGLIQGATLSGLLFLIMMNDLPQEIQECLTIAYADDNQIIISGPPHEIQWMKIKIEEDLHRVSSWMQTNQLKLNVNKTVMLIVGRPAQVAKMNECEIIFQNSIVKRVNELKVLGIILDDKLDFTTQTTSVSKKCNSILAMLFPLRDIISSKSKTILVNALIMSIINYTCIVYFNQTKKNLNVIMGIIRRASRFILRKRYRDSTKDDINNKHKWLTPKNRFHYELCKFAFTVIHEQAPDYFQNYLPTQEITQRQTRRNVYNNINNSNIKTTKNQATKAWADLPDDIKSPIFSTFKKKLYTFILNQQTDQNIINDDNHHICNLSCIESAIYPT